MPSATMTSKGQLTLPIAVREALRLRTGDKVDVSLSQDGTATIRKVSSSFDDLRGIISVEGSSKMIDHWVDEARDSLASGDRD